MNCPVVAISIHAPLAGCDEENSRKRPARVDFNPRTPCGVRRYSHFRNLSGVQFQSTHPLRGATFSLRSFPTFFPFQSTHPLRGATYGSRAAFPEAPISIHAPLAGCDAASTACSAGGTHFNPRTPCGVRPARSSRSCTSLTFQSTHPLRGATRGRGRGALVPRDFNPRTPCGVRQ